MRGEGVYWGTNVLKMSLTCKLLTRKGQREGGGKLVWGGDARLIYQYFNLSWKLSSAVINR